MLKETSHSRISTKPDSIPFEDMRVPHLHKENILEAGKGMEEVVLTFPEDLPQVFIVH